MFFDCLDDEAGDDQPQQQQQSKPQPKATNNSTSTKKPSALDSMFDDNQQDDDVQTNKNNTNTSSQQQQGSKFAAAMAAMRDVKRKDKEQIAIQRIDAVNESESGDLELKRKDKEIGVFRTKGYAENLNNLLDGGDFSTQQQRQQLAESIPVVNIYDSSRDTEGASDKQKQHVETDDEKLERLTKLVAEQKQKRRKERAMKEASPEEIKDALASYNKAQADRFAELKAFVGAK